MSYLFTDLFLPCVYAFLACVGFCFIFNIHGPGILICGCGGALGWMIYLLSAFILPNAIFQCLMAAIAITVFSEVMARVRRCPVTGYLIIALLPLVPGGGIYETMRHCVQGDTQLFLSALLRTFGLAGALALGTLLGSSVVRILIPLFQRTHK